MAGECNHVDFGVVFSEDDSPTRQSDISCRPCEPISEDDVSCLRTAIGQEVAIAWILGLLPEVDTIRFWSGRLLETIPTTRHPEGQRAAFQFSLGLLGIASCVWVDDVSELFGVPRR